MKIRYGFTKEIKFTRKFTRISTFIWIISKIVVFVNCSAYISNPKRIAVTGWEVKS